MASYPSAIWSPSAITLGVTVLEQVLFDDAVAEIKAIETELGTFVNGSAGSLAERIDMMMDQAGNARGLVFNHDASNSQRKRLRAGINEFRVENLTASTHGKKGTLTFSPATQANVIAFVSLQLTESDPGLATIPCFAAFIQGSGTTTSFDFLVCNQTSAAPDPETSFMLHWVAVEIDFSGSSTVF